MSNISNKNFMRTFTTIFALLLLISLEGTNAFVQRQSLPVSAATVNNNIIKHPSFGTMTGNDDVTSIPSKLPTTKTTLHVIPPSPLIDGSGLLDVIDDHLDIIGSSQRILSGMAHVTLDFSTLIRSSATIFRRSIPVFGRIFVMAADYIPDHTIHTEELLVQAIMMGVAIKDLANAVQQQEEETKQSL